jgi:uncharacterized membrane protein YqaE (UPF0057 family)
MPIIRRTRVCTAAYGVLHWMWWLWLCGAGTRAVSRTVTFTVHTARVPAPHNHSHHIQCRTPYAAVLTLVLPMMGIMMPETCWDKSLIINIRLVASCWFPLSSPQNPNRLLHTVFEFAVKCKAKGHVNSGEFRFPDFVTTAQDGGRLSALSTGHLCPQEIPHGTHFS